MIEERAIHLLTFCTMRRTHFEPHQLCRWFTTPFPTSTVSLSLGRRAGFAGVESVENLLEIRALLAKGDW